MTVYTAPTQEIEFVINHLAEVDNLQSIAAFTDATPDMVGAIVAEAAKLAEDVLAPLNHVGDQRGVELKQEGVIAAPGFADAYQQFVDSGWQGLAQPPEYGGQGMPFLLHTAIAEIWNSANMSFALCPMLSVSAIDAMKAHASDELQQRYLEKLVSGEWTGTMNLTEPQAGSDLSALTAKAIPQDDHYLITGTKIFITWGDHDMSENIVHMVLARLPDAPDGVKGISLFLVPKFLVNDDGSLGQRNDVFCSGLEHKMGIHGSPTCVMNFGDDTGAIGYLVGEENQGLSCMFTMMNHARLEVGIEGVGLSERAYQGAVNYARERKQGYKKGFEGRVAIIEHADVKRMLMVMRSLTEASRALGFVAAAAFDHSKSNPDPVQQAAYQQRMDLLTPVVKAWSTEVAQEVTSLGVQVWGGMGYIEESGMAQHVRDARIITIYEGTSGIQANDLIGRKLIRDNGTAMQQMLDEMKLLLGELQSHEALQAMAARLETGVECLEQTMTYILQNHSGHADLAGAAAFNFMMLSGTVMGAAQMAKAALIVTTDATISDDFSDAKCKTANFYMQHILPRALAYQQAVQANPDTTMSLQEEQF